MKMTFKITAWAADGRTVKTITGPVNENMLVGHGDMVDDQYLIDMVKHSVPVDHIAIHFNRSVDEVRDRMKELKNG